MNEVAAKIPARWRDVGIELGLSTDDLDGVSTMSLDPNRCFEHIFSKWKERMAKPYNWNTIIQALRSPQVGHDRLAEALRVKLGGQERSSLWALYHTQTIQTCSHAYDGLPLLYRCMVTIASNNCSVGSKCTHMYVANVILFMNA